jgi:hypothetical protein
MATKLIREPFARLHQVDSVIAADILVMTKHTQTPEQYRLMFNSIILNIVRQPPNIRAFYKLQDLQIIAKHQIEDYEFLHHDICAAMTYKTLYLRQLADEEENTLADRIISYISADIIRRHLERKQHRTRIYGFGDMWPAIAVTYLYADSFATYEGVFYNWIYRLDLQPSDCVMLTGAPISPTNQPINPTGQAREFKIYELCLQIKTQLANCNPAGLNMLIIKHTFSQILDNMGCAPEHLQSYFQYKVLSQILSNFDNLADYALRNPHLYYDLTAAILTKTAALRTCATTPEIQKATDFINRLNELIYLV